VRMSSNFCPIGGRGGIRVCTVSANDCVCVLGEKWSLSDYLSFSIIVYM
jgi:hypothetical protein